MKTFATIMMGLLLPSIGVAADADALSIRSELDALRAEVAEIRETLGAEKAGPKIAYDSGWGFVGQGETEWFEHGVGGEIDRYIVLCESRPGPEGPISSAGYGIDNNGDAQYGFDWHSLNDERIAVYRGTSDFGAPRIRVRIITY